MLPTILGMVMLVKLLQPQNAPWPILLTLLGMTTVPPLPLYFISTPFLISKSAGLIFATDPSSAVGLDFTETSAFFSVSLHSTLRRSVSFRPASRCASSLRLSSFRSISRRSAS